MKKNKNAGFILLETLIVSAFVIGVLVFLYVQFANIKRGYDESFKINTISGLYGAVDLKKHLTNVGYDNLKTSLDESTSGYVEVTCSNMNGDQVYCNNLYNSLEIKNVLFVKEDLTDIKNYLKETTNTGVFIDLYSNDFYKYINRMSVENRENTYRLLIMYNDNTYTSIIL